MMSAAGAFDRGRGFTFLEIILALGIFSLLALTAVPALKSLRERSRESLYIQEAEMVCNAVEAYVLRERAKGTFDEWEIAESLTMYPVSHRKNGLYEAIGDSVSEDAWIDSIRFGNDYESIIYSADGYTIEVDRELGRTSVTKRPSPAA